jgi:hypothetical protein
VEIEPIWFSWSIIHTYMEVPQGNSLCSYLKQAKMSFLLSFFAESENRWAERVLPGGVDTNGMEEEVGKGSGGG